ncbi:hypothetical protein FISHEDRAFT_57807 [Fistulina hepatica ATCC 64428]|uniref:Uncharacterized protein n=1 Tax=Fistulina hepatica ATCC 64428 TaxID=1128425 RepID=A0A0D7AHV8_9AGAR|nr:hypothetical protein FISHEDRAFT_57807 [Fistulina hepatica ATCC 64428]
MSSPLPSGAIAWYHSDPANESIILFKERNINLKNFLETEWMQYTEWPTTRISVTPQAVAKILTAFRNAPGPMLNSPEHTDAMHLCGLLIAERERHQKILDQLEYAIQAPWFSDGITFSISSERKHCLCVLAAFVNSEISQLDQEIDQLTFLKSAIYRMPVEIFVQVFRYLYPQRTSPQRSFSTTRNKHLYVTPDEPLLAADHFVVPYVCKYWREIVDNCMDLAPAGVWLTADVIRGSEIARIAEVEKWAARSNRPLNIVLEVAPRRWFRFRGAGTVQSTALYVKELLKHARRWHSFTLVTPKGDYDPEVLVEVDRFEGSFDLLEALDLTITAFGNTYTGKLDRQRPTLAPFSLAPRLTKLKLDFLQTTAASPFLSKPLDYQLPWEQLLDLTCCGVAHNISEWLQVIRLCPQLETLHFKKVDSFELEPDQGRLVVEPITLSRLRCLMLSSVHSVDLLLISLVCPELSEMRFRKSNWVPHNMCDMIKFSGCRIRTLFIASNYFSPTKAGMAGLLREVPQLEDLTVEAYELYETNSADVLCTILWHLTQQRPDSTPTYLPVLRKLALRYPSSCPDEFALREMLSVRIPVIAGGVSPTVMDVYLSFTGLTDATRVYVAQLSSLGLFNVYLEREPPSRVEDREYDRLIAAEHRARMLRVLPLHGKDDDRHDEGDGEQGEDDGDRDEDDEERGEDDGERGEDDGNEDGVDVKDEGSSKAEALLSAEDEGHSLKKPDDLEEEFDFDDDDSEDNETDTEDEYKFQDEESDSEDKDEEDSDYEDAPDHLDE